MDPVSLIGLVLGIGALVATQFIEGGHPMTLVQAPAALIVFVGTLGATLLSCSSRQLAAALHESRAVFGPIVDRKRRIAELFRDLAFIARKDGLVALDRMGPSLPSLFMRRALRYVIDGCEEKQLEDILDADIRSRMKLSLSAAEAFEIAGGYAPTMGILGAVLGLIRAMESLTEPDALGAGIAVAFVATIYGVGLANLVLLPIASKIRDRARLREEEDTIVAEGALGLQSGISPRSLERLLLAHVTRESGS
ncbi:MAG TPA: flagellar motor protein [Deltaproteobacteria bacterium]|nr:flagellar motor protein [Deltaproteobacteria bacterium]